MEERIVKLVFLAVLFAMFAVSFLYAQKGGQGIRLCPVDGKEIKKDLHVDIVGLRLYACSDECLEKVRQKDFIRVELTKMQYVPEQLPMNRSHARTSAQLIKDMAYIERGEFVRTGTYHISGKETPVEGDKYEVKTPRFYMDKYEATIEDYCKFLNDGNEGYWTPWYSKIKRDKSGLFVAPHLDLARTAVGGVNYYQAKGYAEWAGKRLPREAEWEYAAGGAEGRKFPWGDEGPDETRANYGGKLGDIQPVDSSPKGQTPEGLLNLAGNVAEWCADYYSEDYYRTAPTEDVAKRPRGPESGYLRVIRGGSHVSDILDLAVTTRNSRPPLLDAEYLGFRCCISAMACRSKEQTAVGATRSNESGEQAARLHDISDIEALRSAFNRDKDCPRLVLLLSPT